MWKIFRGRERGQVIMFVAVITPILLGMTGMAVDLGSYAGHKRELQNAADSIALAAAEDLCKVSCGDTAAAASAANTWAAKNNVPLGKVTLSFSGGSTSPKVRVTIESSHNFAFMRIVGIGSRGIGASAAAVKVSFGGSNGIVPWSVTQQTVDATGSGQLMTMKYDATGANIGNFGAIRIDGPGANVYNTSVMYGSNDYACADGTKNCTAGACPGNYPDTCAENAPSCDGPECDPQTGNLIGPTRTGVDFRMNNTSAACDTFDEVFQPLTAYGGTDQPGELLAAIDALPSGGGRMFSPPVVANTPTATFTAAATDTPGPSPTPTATPAAFPTPAVGQKYYFNPDCNPWTDGPGKCVNNNVGTLCSRRVIVIPVVDSFGNGSSDPETIERFALVYLEGYDAGKCQGNNCEIKGRFVNADVNARALAGAYDPQALVHFARLVE